MSEPIRNELGEYAERLVADVLEKREEAIIKAVQAKAETGLLDPQYAIQQWLAVTEARRLRTTLLQRSRTERARHPNHEGI